MNPLALACLSAVFDGWFGQTASEATGIPWNCNKHDEKLCIFVQPTFIIVNYEGLDVGGRLPGAVAVFKASPLHLNVAKSKSKYQKYDYQKIGFPSFHFSGIETFHSKDVVL